MSSADFAPLDLGVRDRSDPAVTAARLLRSRPRDVASRDAYSLMREATKESATYHYWRLVLLELSRAG